MKKSLFFCFGPFFKKFISILSPKNFIFFAGSLNPQGVFRLFSVALPFFPFTLIFRNELGII
jgi:hypothetical protein